MILSMLLASALSPVAQDSVPIHEVLAVESLGRRRRSALNTGALEFALAAGTWEAPHEGDSIVSATGKERTWTRHAADESGKFSGAPFRGGWAFATVEVPTSGAWRLDLVGPSAVLVDGQPHYGDAYGLGITRIPLHLEKGSHEFLFRTGRGSLRATLEVAPNAMYIEDKDPTLPDLLRGETGNSWAGILVCNASASAARGFQIRASVDGGSPISSPVPVLLPSSSHKCAVAIAAPSNFDGESTNVEFELLTPSGEVVDARQFPLRVRATDQKHVRTFRSEIDGSVQYFGVTPPSELSEDSQPAMVLTLHGASVEGKRQSECYLQKPNMFVVAPTNRRAFGFDWEDWGRMDALEVLELAEAKFGTDASRTYLTGHSMGGHGTWQIGAHFPDRFAAIAPSAGWTDFWSYGGAIEADESDPVSALMLRATNVSRTLLLEENYLHGGVYVLHGDADATVSVDQARNMRKRLAETHPNFAYYERAGAGHWWGDQCMDWKPLFSFLRDNQRPESAAVHDVRFTTVNPAISSHCYWVEVNQQTQALLPSRMHARFNTSTGEVIVDAENVSRFSLNLDCFNEQENPPAKMQVGEQEFALASPSLVSAHKLPGGEWALGAREDPNDKNSQRAGPFKDAFRQRMVFVYGTQGTRKENAWALAKARFDHETWRYRGNGSVEVIADSEFVPADFADRGVVLYGNADTNRAWETVLDSTELEVRREFVRVGERTVEGAGLALLAIRPRKDSEVASVAIVGGTGLAGCRVTDFRSYFVSGVGYPDWTLMDTSCLLEGAQGIRAAGFFGGDWSVQNGESAWR